MMDLKPGNTLFQKVKDEIEIINFDMALFSEYYKYKFSEFVLYFAADQL